MPVNAAARIIDITDTRLWRIVQHYANKAIARFDLSSVKAIRLDGAACKRGHNYVTVFIDMQRSKEPALFATLGKGKEVLVGFPEFLSSHKGSPESVLEVV
jgi:hypothetical protein